MSSTAKKWNTILNIVIGVLAIILIIVVAYVCISNFNKEDEEVSNSKYEEVETGHPIATVKVRNYGTFKIELYDDVAPDSVRNFILLANNGFYDNLTFHRVVKDFVIQAGDKSGDGSGKAKLSDLKKEITSGSDEDITYSIKGEFSENGFENNLKYEKGVVGMARADYSAYGLIKEGYNSGSSQFFIVTTDDKETLKYLDGYYASFGKVIEGYDVVEKIENVNVVDEKPTNKIVIESIRVDTDNKKYDYPYIINFDKINEKLEMYQKYWEQLASGYNSSEQSN